MKSESRVRNLRIKVIVLCAVSLVSCVLTYMISQYELDHAAGNFRANQSDLLVNLVSVSEMRIARNKYNYNIVASLIATNNEKRRTYIETARTAYTDLQNATDRFEKAPSDSDSAKIYAPAKEIKSKYFLLLSYLIDLASANSSESDKKAKALVEGELTTYNNLMQDMTIATMDHYKSKGKDSQEASLEEAVGARRSLTIGLVVTVLLILGSFAYITSELRHPDEK